MKLTGLNALGSQGWPPTHCNLLASAELSGMSHYVWLKVVNWVFLNHNTYERWEVWENKGRQQSENI